MRLKVLLPTQQLINEEVTKVVARAENGSFGLLPRHIDFVAALAPGLLYFETPSGAEQFLAVDRGILVKQGPDVQVSTRNAVRGPDLGLVKQAVVEQFQKLDTQEKFARSALAKLEADFVRRFIAMGDNKVTGT